MYRKLIFLISSTQCISTKQLKYIQLLDSKPSITQINDNISWKKSLKYFQHTYETSCIKESSISIEEKLPESHNNPVTIQLFQTKT